MRGCLLAPVAIGLLLTLAPFTLAQQEAQAIIDKAIKAHGGAEKIDKFKAAQTKGKGKLELMGGLDIEQESSIQAPDKLKEVVHLEVMGQKVTVITVFNGTKGWININGQTMDMDEKIVAAIKDALHMMSYLRLSGLKDKKVELTALGEVKVNDRPALGLKIASKGNKDINLYFDKETGLLAKLEYRMTDPLSGQEVNEERIILEYQDNDGLKTAKKLLVNRDGKKYLEFEVLEVKLLEKLDDNEFVKP
jgi:hypothetical protein